MSDYVMILLYILSDNDISLGLRCLDWNRRQRKLFYKLQCEIFHVIDVSSEAVHGSPSST